MTQVPLALYAMRLAPHSATGVSPFRYVFGRTMTSPIDLLYHGWREEHSRKYNMSKWVEDLVDRLELLRDKADAQKLSGSEGRKARYDKGASWRTLEVGDQVLVRTPGLLGKLQQAWTGPWVVKERCGPVTYKVELEDGSGKGLVCHLNTLKRYREQSHTVGRTVVVLDDSNGELEEACEQKKIVGEGSCIGFCRK